MAVALQADDRHKQPRFSRDIVLMVAKIACIIFTIEAIIMMVLFRWDDNPQAVAEGILDSTCLTILASPLIYLWVARPFANAAQAAKADLTRQLGETQRLLDQNEKLSAALQQFSESTAEVHERVLQKIGADLHDGPAQLLTFTLLKLNRLAPIVERSGEKKGLDDLKGLTEVLGQTLREVREISTGLSLPELNSASISDAIHLAVRRHQEFTGTKVLVTCENLPVIATLGQKTCAYRVVQEGLANAFRHAQNTSPSVFARGGAEIEISVRDQGCGFDTAAVPEKSLGLTGMRARVQALGGRFEVLSEVGHGTTVSAYLRGQT